MRINTNVAAMNTYSKLTSANSAKSSSLEKLSSGLRINRAGDDAAGLAISEKMRGQISGLNQATSNAQDGISLIQTAEGALSETHSILQRMRELAVQSSNDTNTDADRTEIQKEIDQLSQEITRISTDTEFNTQNLLSGGFDAKFQIGANANQNLGLSIKDMGANALKVEGIAYTDAVGNLEVTTNNSSLNVVTVAGASGQLTNDVHTSGNVVTVTLKTSATDDTITATDAELKAALESAGLTVAYASGSTGTATATAENETISTLDSGASKDYGINVSTQDAANSAITIIDDAIKAVSAERSKLGATQNRLEHTINNLTATSENLTAAESRIRDVDMAKEMMDFTKNNILSQAATSMLAQANQMPQSVLQLLQ